MQVNEYTRSELINEVFEHTANDGYDNETDTFSIQNYNLDKLRDMSNEELIETMLDFCTWRGEVEVRIIK